MSRSPILGTRFALSPSDARNVPEGGIQMKTELPLLPAVIVAVTIEVTEASKHRPNRLPH